MKEMSRIGGTEGPGVTRCSTTWIEKTLQDRKYSRKHWDREFTKMLNITLLQNYLWNLPTNKYHWSFHFSLDFLNSCRAKFNQHKTRDKKFLSHFIQSASK